MSLPGVHVWRCPSCARQVPLRIEECRCGTARAVVTSPEEPEGATAEAGLEVQAEPSGSGTRTLLVGLLLGLAIAGLAFSWRQSTESNSNTTVASAQPDPIEESGDWEPQVEPEEVVNQFADSPAVTQPEVQTQRGTQAQRTIRPLVVECGCARRCRRTCASLGRVDPGGLWEGHRLLRSV